MIVVRSERREMRGERHPLEGRRLLVTSHFALVVCQGPEMPVVEEPRASVEAALCSLRAEHAKGRAAFVSDREMVQDQRAHAGLPRDGQGLERARVNRLA